MEKKPKYQLNELLEIRNLRMDMTVRITKRIVEGNYDTEERKFYYDFIHVANIEKPWNWVKVSEDSLDELIWEAKRVR